MERFWRATTWLEVSARLHSIASSLVRTTGRKIYTFLLVAFLISSMAYFRSQLQSQDAPPISTTSSTFSSSQTGSGANTLSEEPRYTISNTPTLLVTAFFPLPTSKHTHAEYAAWLKLFLSHIRTPMIIFTSPTFSTTIKAIRGNLPAIIDTNFTTPFDVPPLRGLEDVYARQHKLLDPERARHNPSLYATWNAKAWLLEHAAQAYAAESTKWFFWNDAGALRETHTFGEWPDAQRVQEVFSQGADPSAIDQTIFIPVWDAPPSTLYTRNWKVDDGPLALYKMSEGTCPFASVILLPMFVVG